MFLNCILDMATQFKQQGLSFQPFLSIVFACKTIRD